MRNRQLRLGAVQACSGMALAILATRVLLLWGLDRGVHGVEFTGDVTTHWAMAMDPFRLLFGHTGRFGQYPPLLPLLEALIARPVHAVTSASPFVVMRTTYLVYEVLAAGLVCVLVREQRPGGRHGMLSVGLLVGPMGWVTSTIMAQDETIAAFALVFVLWLLARHRFRTAIVVCSLAVASAKVFFLLPLVAMVWLLPSPTRSQRLLLALGPVGAVYAVVAGAAVARGDPLPFSGFIPRPDYGVNLWALAMVKGGLSPAFAAWASTLLVGLAAGAVLFRTRHPRSGAGEWTRLAGVFSALFLWTWTLFYHVNPEYYLLPVVSLLVLPLTNRMAVWIGLLSVPPWLVNLAFGLQHAASSPSRAHVLGTVGLSVPLLHGIHGLLVVVNSAVTLLVALAVTRLLVTSRP